MSKLSAEIAWKIFVIWMDKEHPYVFPIIGFSKIIIIIGLIASVVFIWIDFSFAWKLGASFAAAFALHAGIMKIVVSTYMDEFKESNKRKPQ